jgi:hypothetical protein
MVAGRRPAAHALLPEQPENDVTLRVAIIGAGLGGQRATRRFAR